MIQIRDHYPLQNDRRFPFYALVPKEFRANLKFRERVLKLGEESPDYRDQFYEMCRRDFLFWLNTFCYLEEPRAEKSVYRQLPFITRGYQDRGIADLNAAVPRQDVCIYKSREVGASWIVMAKAAYDFLFEDNATIGVVSAKDELVDARDNSSLFAKIDFLLDEKRMPWWLLPRNRLQGGLRYVRNTMVFHNPENGSSINGYACTSDVGRGGRKLYFIADECDFWPVNQVIPAFSSMQHNTNCRIALSTANMPGGVYHSWVTNHEERGIKLVDMYWQDDPEKRAGLYTSENGKLKVLDRDFWASVLDCPVADVEDRVLGGRCNYRFRLDGEVTSPYKDLSNARAENPRENDRELERAFSGKGGTFFDIGSFDRTRALWCEPPWKRGAFSFDPDTGDVERWHDDPTSGVLLWIEFIADLENRDRGLKVPPERRFIVAADVAAGTGGSHSSNSVAVVVDANTGEQVGEFATGHMRPDRFAAWCAGVARFFNNALLIWDAHGQTGSSFTKAVVDDLGYGNLYQQRATDRISGRESMKVGFRAPNADAKGSMLNALQSAVDDRRYMIRSEAAYNEIPQYVWKDGKVVHATAVATDDASAMKDAHGDRVIAHALAVEAMVSQGGGKKSKKEDVELIRPDAPYGTLAWRMQQAEERERELAHAGEMDWD